MGTAIRAIGRMANWQKQRGDSDSHDKSHDRSINSTSDSDIASQSDLSVVSLSRPPSHGRLDSRGDNQDISDTTETDEQDEEVFHETKDDKISCESDRCENCENNNKHFKMATHSESSSPAEITKDMLDVESMKGDVVRFDVTVDGSPCPDVQWLHGPNIIKEDTTHSFIQGKNGICSLVIRDICKSDEGEYTCKVTNLSGEDSCSAELFVYGDNAF